MADRWQTVRRPMADRWQTDGDRWQIDGRPMADRWQTAAIGLPTVCHRSDTQNKNNKAHMN